MCCDNIVITGQRNSVQEPASWKGAHAVWFVGLLLDPEHVYLCPVHRGSR
jgi:hypothetical protein